MKFKTSATKTTTNQRYKNIFSASKRNYHSRNHLSMIRWFGWFLFVAIVMFAWKQSLDVNSSNLVNGFFFDKFERLKRITLPSAFAGLGSFLPGLSSGVRVCINFNSQYPQGYVQNTCFLCDAYRFNSIAYQCTGQANCIMNSCQPMIYGSRYPIPTTIGVGGVTPPQPFGIQQSHKQYP